MAGTDKWRYVHQNRETGHIIVGGKGAGRFTTINTIKGITQLTHLPSLTQQLHEYSIGIQSSQLSGLGQLMHNYHI